MDTEHELQETVLQARNLGYAINGKQILTNVTTMFEPRRLTALMGPSGTGKTTLLNVLAARAPGVKTGDVLVNGVPTTLKKMRTLLSYMPQDDVLYMELTVKQLLNYAALMRCPRSWTRQRKLERANAIAATLGLRRVMDAYIHSISGGQRRRSSAAIEFLSGRPILFMDEPTSGLDSATAIALVDQLREAAHSELRTVVATIHQPSWDLLGRFDRVSLLAMVAYHNEGSKPQASGTIVFDGSPALLPAYFSDGGSPCPESENPADHLMYVLADEGGDKWRGVWEHSQARRDAEKRDHAERARLGIFVDDAIYTSQPSDDDVPPSGDESTLTTAMNFADDACRYLLFGGNSHTAVAKYPISFGGQFRVLFMRTAHIWVTDRQQGPLIAKLMIAVYTIVVALLYGMPPNLSKANAVFYFVIAQYSMSMTPLVIIMPEERAVILREYRNGVFGANVYWLARVALALCHAAINAVVTTFFVYPLIGLSLSPLASKLAHWYLFQLLYLSCIMVLGMTIGMVSNSSLTGLKFIVAIQIPWLVTAGIMPPTSLIRPSLFYFRYPNLFTWASKLALIIGFTSKGGKARNTVTDILKFHPGNYESCYWALALAFAIIFCLGVLANRRALNAPDVSAGIRKAYGASPNTAGKKSTSTDSLLAAKKTEADALLGGTAEQKKSDQLSLVVPQDESSKDESPKDESILDRLLEADGTTSTTEAGGATTPPQQQQQQQSLTTTTTSDDDDESSSMSLFRKQQRSPVNKSGQPNYGALDELALMEAGIQAQSVSLELRSVSYRFKKAAITGKKKAIDDVSVTFEAGTMTCLMGPSGAGKTTLLNLLAGRLPTGKYIDETQTKRPCFEGQVVINGRVTTSAAFQAIGTLTPQDEILPSVLTVRQTLMYTAELRSPRKWTDQQRAGRVNAIIEKLGLGGKADNVVGSTAKIGISGGQKKRLSIGMDLLAELPVMLVDEPSTGLDASAALAVMKILSRLATDQRRTIVCTVHQPPWSMVTRFFDQLVLLARGALVYDGPPGQLPAFLAGVGHRPPPAENPCDFAMLLLVTTGHESWLAYRKQYQSTPEVEKRKQNEKILSQLSRGRPFISEEDLEGANVITPQLIPSAEGEEAVEEDDHPIFFFFFGDLWTRLQADLKRTYAVPQWKQFWILFRRIWYIFLIDEDQAPEFIMPCLIASTIVGLSFRNFGTNVFLGTAILMSLFAHGMILLNGIILNMPLERDLIVREYRNGAFSIPAYWAARAAFSLLLACIVVIPMMAIYYPLIGLTRRWSVIFHYYLASTLNASVFVLMACVLGLWNKTALASAQVADPLGSAMAIFSGQIISKHFVKPYAKPIFFAFPISWAFEIVVSEIFEDKGHAGDALLSYYTMKPDNRKFDYAALCTMIFAWLIIGLLVALKTLSDLD